MTEITLKEFLSERTQEQAAKELGVNQSAISQMLAANRDIRINVSGDGAVINAVDHRVIFPNSAEAA